MYFARSGTSAPVAKLLALLADRDRVGLLNDVVAVYHARLLEQRQIVKAEVRTAVPLSSDRLEALQQSLAQVTGKRVAMDVTVDPALIGGVVARIGSSIYDGSVVRQLERMKSQLAQEG